MGAKWWFGMENNRLVSWLGKIDCLAGKMILLTGARGAGKTRLCQQLAAEAQRSGLDAAGVISPAVFENGQKVGIEVQDVRSGERRLLAHRPLPGQSGGTFTPGWAFDRQTLEWGNEILGAVGKCDVLIVDELGPLELEGGQGWLEGIHRLDEGAYRLAVVVVRAELMDKAQQRWPKVETIKI